MQKILYLIFFFISPSAFAADNSGFLDSILEYIKGIFTAITDFVEWLGLLVVEVFKSAWLVLTDLFIWLFVSLFSLAADLLQNIGQLFNINGLTSQVVQDPAGRDIFRAEIKIDHKEKTALEVVKDLKVGPLAIYTRDYQANNGKIEFDIRQVTTDEMNEIVKKLMIILGED